MRAPTETEDTKSFVAKPDVAALQARREATRQKYGRFIQAASKCRREAKQLDASIKRALEKRDATDGD